MENLVRRNQDSLNLREFTQERNLMCAVTVGKPSPQRQCSLSIGELTWERGPVDAMSVGELSPTSCLVKYKRTYTREKQVDSMKVEYPFTKGHSFLDARELLQGKNPVNIMTVQMSSVTLQTSLHISGLLAGRNVVLMEQPAARCASSGDNRELVQERKVYGCHECALSGQLHLILCHEKYIGKKWYILFGKALGHNI